MKTRTKSLTVIQLREIKEIALYEITMELLEEEIFKDSPVLTPIEFITLLGKTLGDLPYSDLHRIMETSLAFGMIILDRHGEVEIGKLPTFEQAETLKAILRLNTRRLDGSRNVKIANLKNQLGL